MAFVRSPFDMDKKNQGTSQSGVIDTSGQATGDQPAEAKQVSNWVNLNNYVNQNQGSGAAMADEMLKGGNQEVGNLNAAGKTFGDTTKAATDSATKKDTGWGSLFSSGDLGGMSQAQKNAYGAWKGQAGYSGLNQASEASGYGGLQDQLGKTKEQAAKSATQDSQYGLAKESLGKGNDRYSSGMSILDTILTRQAGGGDKVDKFNTDNAAPNLENKVSGVANDVTGYMQQKKNEGNAVTGKVQGALDTRLGSMANTLAQRRDTGDYANAQTRLDVANEAERQALKNMGEIGANFGSNKDDLTTESGNSKETNAQMRTRLAAEKKKALDEYNAAHPAPPPVVETATPMDQQPGQGGVDVLPPPDPQEMSDQRGTPIDFNLEKVPDAVGAFVGSAQTGFKKKKNFNW